MTIHVEEGRLDLMCFCSNLGTFAHLAANQLQGKDVQGSDQEEEEGLDNQPVSISGDACEWIVWLFGGLIECFALSLFRCFAVWVFGCFAVWLFGCFIV